MIFLYFSHFDLQEQICCLQPSGEANLLGKGLGPGWEEMRGGSSVSRIIVLVVPKLFQSFSNDKLLTEESSKMHLRNNWVQC